MQRPLRRNGRCRVFRRVPEALLRFSVVLLRDRSAVFEHLLGRSAEPLLDREIYHPVCQEEQKHRWEQREDHKGGHHLRLESAANLSAPALEIKLDQVAPEHGRKNEKGQNYQNGDGPEQKSVANESQAAHRCLMEKDLSQDQCEA